MEESSSNLIVNYLPKTLTDDDFRSIFLGIGPIKQCRIIRDKVTSESYGFGFVEYATENDARRAIGMLNDFKLGDNTIKVALSHATREELKDEEVEEKPKVEESAIAKYRNKYFGGKSTNLMVNYLPVSFTEQNFLSLFENFGTVKNCALIRDKNTKQSLCYGFIDFAEDSEARMAIQMLNNYRIGERSIRVAYARNQSGDNKDEAVPVTKTKYIGGQKTNLMVNNMPLTFTDKEFKSLFQCVGPVMKCAVMVDKKSNDPLGFGFVDYINEEHAKLAIQMLNGYQIADRNIKVALANPPAAEEKVEKPMEETAVQVDEDGYTPGEKTNLIINFLPSTFSEEDFTNVFQCVGPIKKCKVMRDNKTKESLCFGFVDYYNEEDAQQAIEVLNDCPMGGKKLSVALAAAKKKKGDQEKQDKTKLIVNYLPLTMTDEELRVMFDRGGNVSSHRIARDKAFKESFGYGFVEYSSEEDAKDAIKKFDEQSVDGENIKVSFCNAEIERAYEDTLLYVKNMPAEWKKEHLYACFKDFGVIVMSSVFLDPVTKDSRRVAFVQYSKKAEAELAIEEMNEKTPEGTDEPIFVKFVDDRQNAVASNVKSKAMDIVNIRNALTNFSQRLNISAPVPNFNLNLGTVPRFPPPGFIPPMPMPRPPMPMPGQMPPPVPMSGIGNGLPNFNMNNVRPPIPIPGVTSPPPGIKPPPMMPPVSGAVPTNLGTLPGNFSNAGPIRTPVRFRYNPMASTAGPVALPPGVPNSSEGHILYVFNIMDRTEENLWTMFTQYGAVSKVSMIKDDKGGNKNFAFVTMPNFLEAQNAIANLNGREIGGGKCLHVSYKTMKK